MYGGSCSKTIYDGTSERTLVIYLAPHGHVSGQQGKFTLVEDDFKSNDHVGKNSYTEIEFGFESIDDKTVQVGMQVVREAWELPYEHIRVELPRGDKRRVVAGQGASGVENSDGALLLSVRLV